MDNRYLNEFDDFKINVTDQMLDNISEDKVKTVPRVNVDRDLINVQNGGISREEYEDDETEKKKYSEHKKRDRVKAIKNKRVFRAVWFAMVIIVGITFGTYLSTGANDLFAVGRVDSEVTLDIPENVTLEQLSQILYDENAINSQEFFQLYFTVTSDIEYIYSGEKTIATNLDYEGLINALCVAPPRETVYLIFSEGRSVEEIAGFFEEYGVADKEAVLEAANSLEFDEYDMIEMIENDDERYYKVEGYLFPDGYDFYIGEDPESALKKMLGNFQTKITVSIMNQIEESGYTMDEIITIASIIQLEAADIEDMARVSAVIHNRLENGAERDIYSLEMDSTYLYPYKSGSDAIPDAFESRYDTYTIQGLPPGPICNPGTDAIISALNPDPDYGNMYYFCHSADGTAYYASNISDHNQNLVKAGLAE